MPLFALPFPAFDPILIQIGPFAVRWYALAYIAGIFLGWWYAKRLVANPSLWGPAGAPMKPADIDDFVVWAAIGIVGGGRIGYVLFYDLPLFLAHPWEIVAVWHGGMSFHGGFLGTVIAMILFARKRGILIWSLFDVIAPVGDLRPVLRPHRQFRQRRIVGPADRRALGVRVSRRRPGAAPSEPALRGGAGRHRPVPAPAPPHPSLPPAGDAGLRRRPPSSPATARRAPSSSSSASPTSRSATSPAA